MLTIVCGAPGTGKTSLMAYLAKRTYFQQGRLLLKKSRARINILNDEIEQELAMPDRAPIFANFELKLKVGYKKDYAPYYCNPFYLGLPNPNMATQHIPPYSKIFITEAQRYYNSRKSATFPDWVSRWFETHRHYGLDIWLDVQRAMLIDKNIRELCKHVIEVQKLDHKKDSLGRIISSTWYCREFASASDYEEYLENGAKNYEETTYCNAGDIFRSFNSFSCFKDFVPRDGQDFCYLAQLSEMNKDQIAEKLAKFYETGEPKEYRGSGGSRQTTAQSNNKQGEKNGPNKRAGKTT